MKNFLLALALGLLLGDLAQAAPSLSHKPIAEQPTISQRISSAGRIRLQAQRIAKLYQQIGIGLNADASRKQLASASASVDADLSDLLLHSSNQRTEGTLERMSEVWLDMKRGIATSYTLERRNLVNYLAEDLTMASGKLAMQIERDAETPAARLLDLSLRQSMLVQRLARLYMMTLAGDNSYGRQVDIEQTRKEFSTALNELIVARENSQASRDALELAKIQWLFFENAFEVMNNSQGRYSKNVATTSERILEALDSVTAQYVQENNPATNKDDPKLAQSSARNRRN